MADAALEAVKADLAARIAALDSRAARARPRDLAPAIDEIRSIAHRHRLDPAVTVTHFLGAALARGEHGALLHGWLTILNDAVACDRHDVATCDAFAAACSVRLAS